MIGGGGLEYRKHAVGCLVIGFISVALLACAGTWALREYHETKVLRALHDIGVAIHNHRVGGAANWLPETFDLADHGDSWRFALLPYLEHARSDAFHNSWETGPYRNACHRTYCLTGSQNKDGFYTTNILAIVGPGTIAESPPSTYQEDAIILAAVGNTSIAWGLSGDMRVDEQGRIIDPWPEPIYGKWIGICFADGRTWLLNNRVPREKLELFFTVDRAQEYSADEILGPYMVRGECFGNR